MNIFVAKLGPNTTNEDLHEIFSNYGEVVSAKVIMDRDTGQSKRYGFVEMANDDEGYSAIQGLNESELDDNRIVVKKSEPRASNHGGGGGRDNRRRQGGFRERSRY
ncbi:MAG: RNA-binding protein [Bacteroidales bacterium]|nr:RNA-binding protein [Bacteroidales bacterium]